LNAALRYPERVAGIVVITPAYSGDEEFERGRIARWDALSDALRTGGVDGFVAAYGIPQVASPSIAKTIATVTRQRLSLHDHTDALADCLRWLPRSVPFGSLDDLRSIDVPAAVVVSSDDADPEHPEALGISYAQAIPSAELITDDPGGSPIAWQGSRLSQVIGRVVARSSLAT
jgi:pimeloyl-ACP methyl ester carboxylesterase